jgi:hypothetical protein
MNKILLAIAFSIAVAGAAQALPVSNPLDTSNVIQVAGGCGEGWHRGPRGGCRRNFARPWLHACPRGYHMGPYGRCRGNF